MAFVYNLDDIVDQFNIRKDSVKRQLLRFGFVNGVDYIIDKQHSTNIGGRPKEIIKITQKVYDQLNAQNALFNRKEANNCRNVKLEYIKRYLPEEIEIINFIYESLSSIYTMKKQYKVMSYFIDLYIQDANIAIECDEYGHQDRDQHYEVKRQNEISKVLGCTFIRFNPHDNSFKLSNLMSTIIKKCIGNTHELNV